MGCGSNEVEMRLKKMGSRREGLQQWRGERKGVQEREIHLFMFGAATVPRFSGPDE